MLNILPAKIAEELKTGNRVEPRYHPDVTIMFTDFRNFTGYAELAEPRCLINQLDRFFSKFDEIVRNYGLEKLETIGDAYMCAGGLPEEHRLHAVNTCLAAIEFQQFVAEENRQCERIGLPNWDLRIGIHTGPVMAGVVGKLKFTYDIWGDAANLAAAIEAKGTPGEITLSESTYHRIKHIFEATPHGSIQTGSASCLNMFELTHNVPRRRQLDRS